MPRVLAIDDEAINLKLILHTLEPLGYQVDTALNGAEGFKAACATQPDLIITDVMMPEMSGYELTRRLRRDPRFAHTPILVLTSQAEIQDKLHSFEAGADDHMTKPFDVAELIARVGVLLRRYGAAKTAQALTSGRSESARLIAVHSLRGGTGCSSLAVNLALALAGLWDSPTILIDLALTAGQAALMLNSTLKRTWADLASFNPNELDMEVLQSVISQTEGGLHLVSAPTRPTDAEQLTVETLNASLALMRQHYDYIVADLPHDFGEISLQTLDTADTILLVLAPELASVRAAVAALDTYAGLNYNKEKIKLVMSSPFPRMGLSREKIESAVGMPIAMGIPYTPDKFVEAINLGQPLLITRPNEPVSALIEDFAFFLSKDSHKKTRPVVPTAGWKRVYKRFTERRK